MQSTFRQLVDLHQNRVYSLALYLLRDRAEAEDVCQEAYTKLWRHLDKVETPAAKAWLLKVTRNLCLDRLRARQSFCDIDEHTTLIGGDEPQQSLAHEQLQRWLSEAICQLKEPYKSLIVLRDMQQHSYEHIGQTLALNLNQVKSYLFRARRQLRDLLRDVSHKIEL
jgi:RNA polymerase sigma-70 factor, ECF subfamily